MNREILFRGRRLDNGEWVAGWFVRLHSGESKSNRIYTGYAEKDCGEYFPDWFEVDPATVGHYTGMTDKSDRKIFEGDIFSFRDDGVEEFRFVVQFGQCGGVKNTNRPVGFMGFYFEGADNKTKKLLGGGIRKDPLYWLSIDYYDVSKIGNRWDNPELLEEAGGGE